MEKDISKNILNKIKKEEIKPKSRWSFIVKNIVFWVVFVASLILGSLSTSIAIFNLRNNYWDLYQRVGQSLFAFTMRTIPYLWLLFLMIFIILSFYLLKKTKSGYKYNPYLVISLNILISIILGSFLYVAGLGEKMEGTIEKRMPVYQKMFYQKHEMWKMPEKGLVAGVIISVENEDDFKIKALKGEIWRILAREALISDRVIIRGEERVKVIGEKIDINTIKAEEIIPFMGPGGEMKILKNPERKIIDLRIR